MQQETPKLDQMESIKVEKRPAMNIKITFYILLFPVLLAILSLPTIFSSPNWAIFIIGFIAFLICFYIYKNTFYRERIGKIVKLDKNNRKISATVIKIARLFIPFQGQAFNTFSKQKFYTDPLNYIIVASWKDNAGNEHIFKSPILGTDPEETFKVGGGITVYLNPKNYSKYYVDIGDTIR